MSKLDDWQAAIEEYDAAIYAMDTLSGEDWGAITERYEAAKSKMPDLQKLARALLPIAIAAERLERNKLYLNPVSDDDLHWYECAFCQARLDHYNHHDNCPIKIIQDAIAALEEGKK